MEITTTLSNIVCIPITISILAIAFPLLLQTTSKIDEKYSSTRLTKTFYKEKSSRIFISLLISTLIFILIWVFRQPRLIEIGFLNRFIDNSAILFLALSTISLVLSLFYFVRYIKIYYNPEHLLEHLIKIYSKSYNSKKRIIHFKSISDLLFYSIEHENEEMARELLTFFTEVFMEYRKNKNHQFIDYPDEFYDAIFAANEQLCLRQRKTTSYYNGNVLVNLFIDGYHETSISEKTFSAIWRCLRQDIEYDNDDFIMSYWKNAHQHFDFYLSTKQMIRKTDFDSTNINEAKKLDVERKRFLEFHYALGGLLYFQKKYRLIKRLMEYTNQSPPEFHLIPDSISKIIYWYTEIGNIFPAPFYYEMKYPFPNVEGANSDGIIRMRIKKYIALLLLKQYTLYDYYIGQSALAIPQIPDSLPEINKWKNNLIYLKAQVTKLLEKGKIINKVGLGFMNSDWFSENNKLEPIALINEIIERAENKYEEVKRSQPISVSKKAQFEEKTKAIIFRGLDEYADLKNEIEIVENFNSFNLNGAFQIMDKDAFADNQEIAIIDADTVVAEMVIHRIHHKISSSFLRIINERYIINQDDIFDAIKAVISDLSDIIIFSFGIYFPFYISQKVPGLSQKDNDFYYNGIKIKNFNYTSNESLQSSFVILKKEDLPSIIYNGIDQGDMDKYRLSELDNQTHLSTNIINLNEDPVLLEEATHMFKEKDLTKNVIVCIGLNAEIRWKNSAKGYLISIFDQFINSGKANTLDEIKPI